MYDVLEVSLGDLTRLYDYIQRDLYRAKFGLKGFDYPWMVESHAWGAGQTVLDVGAAYSTFPCYLSQTYGCEVWAVDDFGMSVDDPYWLRSNSPQEFIDAHPEVKYVVERLGDPAKSSLPENYFDVIYSISVLEHVPQPITQAVWKHMSRLLKPGGVMLHAIDFFFPSNGGMKKMLAGTGIDLMYPILPKKVKTRACYVTPKAYTRLAFEAIGIKHAMPKELDVWNAALNPEIVTEDYHHGLNRIVKDKAKNYRYQRTGTLLIKLRKQG
jgi:2-polyprenyl-3-methyl-5-hydroxy-6-metoxy-1,4-benzoquinol methylase